MSVGVSSMTLAHRLIDPIRNTCRQIFSAGEVYAFTEWAVAHVRAVLYRRSLLPHDFHRLSREEAIKLTPQKIYWLNVAQRKALNTSLLTPDQQTIFFLSDRTCRQILEAVDERLQRRKIVTCLSQIKEMDRRFSSDEDKQHALQDLLQTIAEDSHLKRQLKMAIFTVCVEQHGRLIQGIDQIISDENGLKVIELLISIFHQKRSEKSRYLSEFCFNFVNMTSKNTWQRLKIETIIELIECRFNHHENQPDAHHTLIYERLKASPEKLQQVIQAIGEKHQGNLIPYGKFLAESFAKSNEVICKLIIKSLVKLDQQSVEGLLQIIETTILEKRNVSLLRNAITYISQHASEPKKFKTMVLDKTFCTLQSSIHHIYDQPHSRDVLWEKHDALTVSLLNDPSRLQKALDKWKRDKSLDSFNLCIVHFLLGAAILSSCSYQEFEHFLNQTEKKNSGSSSLLLLLSCCGYLKFSHSEQNFSDLIARKIFSKATSSELIRELKQFSFPESEVLASVVFDLIRRQKGSENFTKIYLESFLKESQKFQHLLEYVPYLKEDEIGMLVSQIFHAHKHLHPVEVCSRLMEALTFFTKSNPFSSKHPKLEILMEKMLSQLSEENQRKAWSYYISIAPIEKVFAPFKFMHEDTRLLALSFARTIMDEHFSLIWDYFDFYEKSAEGEGIDWIVMEILSSSKTLDQMIEDLNVHHTKTEVKIKQLAHAIERVIISGNWPFEKRLLCLHSFATRLSEPLQKQFFHHFDQIGQLLFVDQENIKNDFVVKCLQNETSIEFPQISIPDVLSEAFFETIPSLVHHFQSVKRVHTMAEIAEIFAYSVRFTPVSGKQMLQKISSTSIPRAMLINFDKIKTRLLLEETFHQECYRELLHAHHQVQEKIKQEVNKLSDQVARLTTRTSAEDITRIKEAMLQVSKVVEQGLKTLRKWGSKISPNPLSSVTSEYSAHYHRLKGTKGVFSIFQDKTNHQHLEDDFSEKEGMMEEVVIYNAVNQLKPKEGSKIPLNAYLEAHQISWVEISQFLKYADIPISKNPFTQNYEKNFIAFGITSFELLKKAIIASKKYAALIAANKVIEKTCKTLQELEEHIKDKSG